MLNTNPSNKIVEETVLLKDSRLMNYSGFNVVLGNVEPLTLLAGLITINLDAHGFAIYKLNTKAGNSYTPYKRV